MTDSATSKAEAKKDWALTGSALRRLLDWLDEGADSGGEKYLEMRRRLVSFFVRKNCLAPHDLADETLNRVARRLEEEEAMTDTPPARYCYIVAKFVFLESLRQTERHHISLAELPGSGRPVPRTVAISESQDTPENKEKLFDCLEHCLRSLESGNRELIFQYYQGEQRAKIKNRRALAARLGLTMNALSIRACRIRERLEACVSKCADG